MVFLILYILTLAGNAIIVTAIHIDHHLHTPMSFFLSVLSTSKTFYSLVIIPCMPFSLVGLSQSISLEGCGTQLFFFLGFAITNCLLLAVMGYDRYVAICNPLRYSVIMNWRVCTFLAIACWSCGLCLAIVQVSLFLRLPFCGPQKVNHFFCEIQSVLKVTCGDIWINEMFLFADGVFILVGPLSLMLVSYVRILWAILKIQSKEGRRKAFSICSSHLCVVGFYFGIAMMVYLAPDSSHREEQKKILFLFYSLFNPLLNPLVYSVRNAQVKAAFHRVLQKRTV